MARVSLLKCETYDVRLLKKKICEALEGIGFPIDSFSGKRIALKPNLLAPAAPEKAVTTNPAFVKAVSAIVRESGGHPVIIESPAIMPVTHVMKRSGYQPFLDESGIEIADSSIGKILRCDQAEKYRRFEISRAYFDVDMIINLPKLKTHGLMYMTCAVKNLFGAIPGMNKARSHVKAKTNVEFAVLLVDLYCCLYKGFNPLKEILHIVDAVMGMEGEGPGPSGTPRKIGALLAGRDGIAVDAVAVNLLGLKPEKVPTIAQGRKMQLGESDISRIDVVGDSLDDMRLKDFVPTTSSQTGLMTWFFNSPLIRNLFIEKPWPLSDKCVLCYQCRKICPAGAIGKSTDHKVPAFDYQKCIRCYCCMEICPEAAIVIKKGLLQKFVS